MSGYLFLLDDDADVKDVFNSGVYSTRMSLPKGHWGSHHESTLADFLSMRDGDWVFFFQKRRIHGVGRLISIGGRCTFLNYPTANLPTADHPDPSHVLLHADDLDEAVQYRWLCTFEGHPGLLSQSVDMDDALAAHPHAFRSLRIIEKRTFIKMDEEEANALLNVLSRRNGPVSTSPRMRPRRSTALRRIAKVAATAHSLTARDVLTAAAADDGSLRHEMAVEAGLVEALSIGTKDATSAFGSWTFVTHQVAASPFKPIIYMDRIDVFGHREFEPFGTIGAYLVVEIKAKTAGGSDVDQLMKYVDWTASQYCGGDYSMIRAFLVAFDFEDDAADTIESHAQRGFTVGARPVVSRSWKDVGLVKYRFDNVARRLRFSRL